MNLILVRHAEAVPHGTTDDELRELTPHGRIQAAALAAALAARGVTAGAVVSSPLVRARQTAEALAERFTDGRVTETPYLSIDKFKKRRLTAFAAVQGQETVVLVGHQPSLGEYAAWLLGAEKTAVPFEKAGAALIRFERSAAKEDGELVWLVTPEWFL